MHKIILISLFLFQALFALEFKVSSYNVKNLFDLKHDKTEYKEYIPYTNSNWNEKTYNIKLQNTVRVIKELKSDIVALQEIESKRVFNDLQKHLPQYPYSSFIKNKNASIGLAVLSKFPITQTKKLIVNSKVNRPIQEVSIKIKDQIIIIYNNHWASKRQKESQRIVFAMALQKHLKSIPPLHDYILLGDFNSNYNELETIRYEKRLNDTQGLTGINHVLNTYIKENFINKKSIFKIAQRAHYNLWFELAHLERFSSKFRGNNVTPDNIILPKALFDQYAFSYLPNSFEVFKPNYLYDKKVKRWIIKHKKHLGLGYSDHLPISAKFTTNRVKQKIKQIYSLNDLYKINQLTTPLKIENATVIYKYNNHAIIKKANSRAIFLYNCAKELKEGYNYNLNLLQLKEYQGLKEITKIEILKKREYEPNYKALYTYDISNLDDKQNEILTQIKGVYKKGFLHTSHKKIKLYAKDKSFLPKNGQKVTIISGHLGYYKKQAQIILYKQSDIKVEP